jgi:hypothetical protein
MKTGMPIREIARMLFGLVIVVAITIAIISTLRRPAPGSAPAAIASTPTSSPQQTATPPQEPTTAAPYPVPWVHPLTLTAIVEETNAETYAAVYATQKALAGTMLANRTPITPFFEPTGIYSDTYVQASGSKIGMDAQNDWFGFVDGNSTTVYAGALLDEPDQGVVHLFINFRTRGFEEQILTPTKHGWVRVVSEKNNRLTLVSSDGTTYYFDVPARRFVDSQSEVVPSATPLPTYTPFPLPGTVLPYLPPAEQSTVVP